MPFTYTPDTPQASHFPANDQPLMNSNNRYLQEFGTRDHQFTLLGAANSTDGTHKQVTLTNQAAPGFGGANSAIYANLANGQSQLFFENASGSTQLTTQIASVPTIATNGTSYLPGGLLIQWGFAVTNGSGDVSFPVAFSVATFLPNVTFTATGTIGNNVPLMISTSAASFRVSQAGIGVYWKAIGQAV